MPVATNLARSPVSDPGEGRDLLFVVGYSIASFALAFAWLSGAGVETSPFDFYSGPSLSSLLLLFGAIGMLGVGAAIVAVFGSIYGNNKGAETPTPSTGPGASAGRLGRSAVFLVIFGVGLLLMGLSLPVSNLGINHSGLPSYISPTVLFVPEIVDGLALGALALGISLLALGRRRHPSEFRGWWRRTGRYVTVAGVTVLIVMAALLVVPVHQSFSTQLGISGGSSGGITVEWFPAGIAIVGSWSANPTGVVNLTIQGGSGTNFTFNASSGTFAFVTSGVPWGVYTFFGTAAFPETVTINGTFYAPTWAWPPGEPGEPTALLR